MATYNGQLFIKSQLTSILKQLASEDEVVIVDDVSTDNTLDIIEGFKDTRIRVFRNPGNLGVVKTFENALSKASGDIIYLSDQDDVWLDNKVDKIISVFEANPDITLVLSDAQLIDSNGDLISHSFFSGVGGFRAGAVRNIVSNRYLGCTMAFKRNMLHYFLPIPHDIPMHDMWIGILNNVFGKVSFINEPLIQYRRHSHNATSLKHANFSQMLRWRISLVKNLLRVVTVKVLCR